MKTILLFVIGFIVFINLAFCNADDGLVGHWMLDSLEGDVVSDISGNGNSGKLEGKSKPKLVDTEKGKALLFDGAGYINCGNDKSLDIEKELTISMWIYPTAYPSSYAVMPLAKWKGTKKANYVVYFWGDLNKAGKSVYERFRLMATAGGKWQALSPRFHATLNQWYHLAFTYNSSSGGKMYVNGEYVRGSVSGTGELSITDSPLIIGGGGTNKEEYFKGIIKDVRIYNRSCSASEVRESMDGYSASSKRISILNNDKMKILTPISICESKGVSFENNTFQLLDAVSIQSSNMPIVIECEKASEITFQRNVFKLKEKNNTKPSLQYVPQYDDPEAFGGYIDYCSNAVYHFSVSRPGQYTLWARHWVPVKGKWAYRITINGINNRISKKVNLHNQIPEEKKWFWFNAFTENLPVGDYSLTITDLHNGKRIDRIMLTDNKGYRPDDKEKSTSIIKYDEGYVTFDILPIWDTKDLKSFTYEINDDNNVKTSISFDKGNTYLPVAEKSMKFSDFYSKIKDIKDIRIKIDFKRIDSTPIVKSPLICTEVDLNDVFILKDETVELSFLKKTGYLLSLKNNETNSIYYSFNSPYSIWSTSLGNDKGIKSNIISSENSVLQSSDMTSKGVSFVWLSRDNRLKVSLLVSLDGKGVSKWLYKIDNNSQESIIDFTTLMIPEANIQGGKDLNMVWPRWCGEIHTSPLSESEQSRIYPGSAFPWIDLYNKNEGLYVGCHDLYISPTEIRSLPVNKSMRGFAFTKHSTINSGHSQEYSFAIGVHKGDWHQGSRIYSNFFYKNYPRNLYTPWFREIDGYSMGRGIAGYDKRIKSYTQGLEQDFKQAIVLGIPYIQGWGSTFAGACPTYYGLRAEMGGEEQFSKQIKRWRNSGGNIGYYYHGNSVSVYPALSDKYLTLPWSSYPVSEQPSFDWEWYVKNRLYLSPYAIQSGVGSGVSKAWVSTDDNEKILREKERYQKLIKQFNLDGRATRLGGIPDNYPPMSWEGEFPEYLYNSVAKYINSYKCNTAYLDTFSCVGTTSDYNPYYNLNGSTSAGKQRLDWLKRTVKKLRENNSSINILSEGACDIYGIYLSHMIASMFAGENSNIYRYAFPDQIIFQGGVSNNTRAEANKRKDILSKAFLNGCKLDTSLYGIKRSAMSEFLPFQSKVLRLRQMISPFLNYAVYKDTDGISLSDSSIVGYSHVISEATRSVINHQGSKAITITVRNPKNIEGEVSCLIPEGIVPKYAYIAELGNENLVPLKFKVEHGNLIFKTSKAELSAAIFIDKALGECEWTARITQKDNNTLIANIYNFAHKPISVSVKATPENSKINDAIRELNISNGKRAIAMFKNTEAVPIDKIRLVKVTISSNAIERTYVSGFGDCSKERSLFEYGK